MRLINKHFVSIHHSQCSSRKSRLCQLLVRRSYFRAFEDKTAQFCYIRNVFEANYMTLVEVCQKKALIQQADIRYALLMLIRATCQQLTIQRFLKHTKLFAKLMRKLTNHEACLLIDQANVSIYSNLSILGIVVLGFPNP